MPAAVRTRFYIDGFNLYFGCLKRSPYKWLDPCALMDRVLPSVNFTDDQGNRVAMALDDCPIKYFTADLLEKLARKTSSYPNQQTYYRALEAHLGPRIILSYGAYTIVEARAHVVEKGIRLKDSPLKDIWKVEEKQTDVSLALEAYGDALRGAVDQVVLVTNDTDHVPTVEKIKRDSNVLVGVISPNIGRYMNNDLTERADWSVGGLSTEQLLQSQLPPFIRGGGKNFHKPVQWYPRPDLLEPIFQEAKRVRGSAGSAWRWLHEPSPHLGDEKPIQLAETQEGAQRVQSYQDAWARNDKGHNS